MITPDATHQQTKRLVDPGNGTYETVLAINSSCGICIQYPLRWMLSDSTRADFHFSHSVIVHEIDI